VVPGTNHEAKLDLERSAGMSREGIEHWKQPIGAAAGFNSFESMVQDVLGLDAPLAPLAESTAASPFPTHLRSAPVAGPGVRTLGSASKSDDEEEKYAVAENPFAAALSANPADSLIPQRKPGASAMRTFAAKPQSLADAAPIWEEDENIPVENTVEFTPEKQNGRPPSAGMTFSRLLFNAVGFVVFSAFGLALGYVILHFIMPDKFKWPWQ
jgi:hypothetical protein